MVEAEVIETSTREETSEEKFWDTEQRWVEDHIRTISVVDSRSEDTSNQADIV